MKNCLKGLGVIALSLLVSVSGVNATTATAKINTNACTKVYTNYYFFLEAETSEYMTTNNARTMRNTNIATYKNHFYSTNFNPENVGYGQVNVSRNSYDSADGITSMSLETFYKNVLRASNERNGAYSFGNNNYFFIHDWYKFVAGMPEDGGASLSIANFNYPELMRATMDADTEMVRIDAIRYQNNSTFSVNIARSNYRNFGSAPVRIGNKYSWYLHPAVYYVQYCAEKPVNYNYLEYVGNGANVYNVPAKQTFEAGKYATVSSVVPVNPGYTFVGWSTYPNATTPNYYAGNVVYNSTTLYAVWSKTAQNTYSVVYRANTTDNVANMPDAITKNVGENTTISTVTPVRKGYTFLGWSSVSGATTIESKYNAGSTYTDGKDLVLYAVWKKDSSNNNNNTIENPKTGVEDYILPFGGVTLASLAGFVALKKKKSFLQF